MSGPCSPWVPVDEVAADPAAKLSNGDALDETLLANMIDVASELLYRLSGRQFPGVCEDTVRPLRRYYDSTGLSLPPLVQEWRQQWGIHLCGMPPQRAGGCGPLSEITLGAYPVREILEVRIDGQIVDPTTYRIDDSRWLVRVDQSAGATFPCCQNLAADPATDVDSFQVQFRWGQDPPRSGIEACKAYAIELAKARSGDECNLPERVQTIAMQQTNFALLDPMTFLDKGRTGFYLADMFITSVNPNGLQRRAQVISPDIGRPVRRAGTGPAQ